MVFVQMYEKWTILFCHWRKAEKNYQYANTNDIQFFNIQNFNIQFQYPIFNNQQSAITSQ